MCSGGFFHAAGYIFTRYYGEILRVQAEAGQDRLPHRANASELPRPHRNTAYREAGKEKGVYHGEHCANAHQQPTLHNDSANKSLDQNFLFEVLLALGGVCASDDF